MNDSPEIAARKEMIFFPLYTQHRMSWVLLLFEEKKAIFMQNLSILLAGPLR